MVARAEQVLGGIGVCAAALALLVGCAGSAPPGAGTARPTEPGVDADLALGAAWLENGASIGLVTEGSSTCVPTASDAIHQDGRLTVTLVDTNPDAPCTMDLVRRVTVVAVPDDVDPLASLRITVEYVDAHGEIELVALPAAGQTGTEQGSPSAGWVDDSTLVLLTYGSSSRGCYPHPKELTATRDVITVTMAAPAADVMCTADFAPQGTLLQLEGGASGSDAELELTGHGFDTVRVPIIGTR